MQIRIQKQKKHLNAVTSHKSNTTKYLLMKPQIFRKQLTFESTFLNDKKA